MRIRIWRGYHSAELPSFVASAWREGDLLILCPPLQTDFRFVPFLPASSEFELCGTWDEMASARLTEARAALNRSTTYPDRPVLGVFTSGTIGGTPRLVLYSKTNIESSLNGILGLFEPTRIDSVFCYPQPFHTFGLLLGYVLAMRMGIPLTTPDGKYGQASHKKRVRLHSPGLLTLGTPTHFYDLARFVGQASRSLAPSYSCILGGAPVSVALWKQARDVLKIEAPTIGYGCTEASPGISHHPPGREPQEDGEVGFPLPGLRSRIIKDRGIEIQGPSLCLAIVDRALEFPTSLTIRDDIEVRDNGMWVYRRRHDLVINRGGLKISLESVERILREELDITATAVGVQSERLNEDLGLLVLDSTGRDHEFLFLRISALLESRFQIRLPSSLCQFTNEFPVNASAKIDRAGIAKMFGTPVSREARLPGGLA